MILRVFHIQLWNLLWSKEQRIRTFVIDRKREDQGDLNKTTETQRRNFFFSFELLLLTLLFLLIFVLVHTYYFSMILHPHLSSLLCGLSCSLKCSQTLRLPKFTTNNLWTLFNSSLTRYHSCFVHCWLLPLFVTTTLASGEQSCPGLFFSF